MYYPPPPPPGRTVVQGKRVVTYAEPYHHHHQHIPQPLMYPPPPPPPTYYPQQVQQVPQLGAYGNHISCPHCQGIIIMPVQQETSHPPGSRVVRLIEEPGAHEEIRVVRRARSSSPHVEYEEKEIEYATQTQ